DIVFLEIGDVVPADSLVLWAKDFHVDESTLTGEAFPAQKNKNDKIRMATTVANGEAIVTVTTVGKNTEFGKIAETLMLKRPETDFQKGLRKFGLLIAQFTLVLVLL